MARYVWLMTPEWLSAGATAISALTGLVLAWFTFRLADLTKVLATETRATREASERANVQCSSHVHEEFKSVVELVIVNTGSATAAKIVVNYGPRFRSNELRAENSISFSKLLPGEKVRITLGSYVELKDETVHAAVKFSDKFGEHAERYEQRMADWLGWATMPDRPEFASARALGKIAQTLDHWNGLSRLQVDTFNAEDRAERMRILQQSWDNAEIEQSSSTPAPPTPTTTTDTEH